MTTILAPIGSLLFSFGIVLVFVAGWMRLCDSGSDLAGRVLGAGGSAVGDRNSVGRMRLEGKRRNFRCASPLLPSVRLGCARTYAPS